MEALPISKKIHTFTAGFITNRMKQIVALGMLIVILLCGSHATVMFHYCGGEFRSATFVHGAEKSCCAAAYAKAAADGSEEAVRRAPCCSNEYRVAATDDFYSAPEVPATDDREGTTTPVFEAWKTAEIGFSIRLFQSVFPPGGWTGAGIDRLLLLCTLII
jgi:hypothetical protein